MKTCGFFFTILLLGMAGALAAQSSPPEGWKLLWADEFDGPELGKVWRFSEGANGWGNGELENYTTLKENVRIEDGHLTIEARKTDGSPQYTSGRISTHFGFAFTYGRVEAKMKIPQTQGLWPAFWMLGDTNSKSWPACGEIDIMEAVGKNPNLLYGTAHGPGYSGGKGIGKTYLSPTSISDDWHVVAVEWEPAEIRWYFDGQLYHTMTPADLPKGKKWVFDHDFYLLINLAVGGGFPDYPNETSVFPQQFQIDYVRIYQRE